MITRLGVAAVLLVVASGVTAEIRVPEASPGARVAQEIGVAEIEIIYHRPGVKKRTIWGGLVPWSEVWRVGANEATTLRLSHDATIDGHPLPAGTYSLFAIPGREAWTIIVNGQAKQWGTFRYDQQQDVVRFDVTPRAAEHVEMMELEISPVSEAAAVVSLAWEKLRVSFDIEFPTERLVWRTIDQELAKEGDISWREYQKAAQYALLKKQRLGEALVWAEKAMVDENFWRYDMRAKLLEAHGRTREAVEWIDRAIDHAKAGIESGAVPKAVAATYLATLEKTRAEWRTKLVNR